MKRTPQTGFTLVELVTTLAVAAVLLGIGIPSFSEAIKNSRISVDYNDLVQALYLARSESVKSSNPLTVCARASDTSCGSDWNNGWLAFIDNTYSNNEATAAIDGTDEILLVKEGSDSNNTFRAIGSSDLGANSASTQNYIRYTVTGETNWGNGSFIICDERGAESGRSINIGIAGDIKRGRKSATSDAPLDVYGREITCP